MSPKLPFINPKWLRINFGEGGRNMGTETAKAEVLVRGPGEGPATWALGSLFERLASHRETAGTFGLSLVTQPPGAATPLHVHTQEDEAFYVLDGNLTYSADGQIYRLSPGS